MLVTQERLCADLCVKYGIKDGITKKVEDTVDGISFDKQVEIIALMQQIVDDYEGKL